MAKRKGLSNKIRFEVFKRDSFKCQYCGATAPEVVLNVDHIKPVSRGGTNNILNLVTACKKCNNGKSAIELSDNSEIAKQRAALEELNERRAQLEMMFEWRESIDSLDSDILKRLISSVCDKYMCGLTDHGISNLRRSLKTYGLQDTLTAVDICAERYLLPDVETGRFTNASTEMALNKVGATARFLRTEREDPTLAKLLYVRGIIKNRCKYFPKDVTKRLQDWFSRGVTIEELTDFAKAASSWDGFSEDIGGLFEEAQ